LLTLRVMSQRLVILLLVLSAGTVHADPAPADRGYVSVGVASGAGYTVDWLYAGLQLEGGYRLSDRWYAHGEAGVLGRSGYGTTQDLTLMVPREPTYEARAGLEARGCHSSALCGYAGMDAGYRVSTGMDNNYGTGEGVVVVPRAGLDLGLSRDLRFRPGVELRLTNGPASSDAPFAVGIGASAALAYRF
jgi:hypothetical protein